MFIIIVGQRILTEEEVKFMNCNDRKIIKETRRIVAQNRCIWGGGAYEVETSEAVEETKSD